MRRHVTSIAHATVVSVIVGVVLCGLGDTLLRESAGPRHTFATDSQRGPAHPRDSQTEGAPHEHVHPHGPTRRVQVPYVSVRHAGVPLAGNEASRASAEWHAGASHKSDWGATLLATLVHRGSWGIAPHSASPKAPALPSLHPRTARMPRQYPTSAPVRQHPCDTHAWHQPIGCASPTPPDASLHRRLLGALSRSDPPSTQQLDDTHIVPTRRLQELVPARCDACAPSSQHPAGVQQPLITTHTHHHTAPRQHLYISTVPLSVPVAGRRLQQQPGRTRLAAKSAALTATKQLLRIGTSRVHPHLEPRHALERYRLRALHWTPPAVGQPKVAVNMTWEAGTPSTPSAKVNVVFACVAVDPATRNGTRIHYSPKVLRHTEAMLKSIVVFSPNASLHFFALVDVACADRLRNMTREHAGPPGTIRGHRLTQVPVTKASLLRVVRRDETIVLEKLDARRLSYGIAAFAVARGYALLPDVDFAIVVDLNVVFVQDIRFLWREFRSFSPQEVFAHARQRPTPREGIFKTPPQIWDSYNAGVSLYNFARYRQLLAARPPRQVEQALAAYAADRNVTFVGVDGGRLWCLQIEQCAYHY